MKVGALQLSAPPSGLCQTTTIQRAPLLGLSSDAVLEGALQMEAVAAAAVALGQTLVVVRCIPLVGILQSVLLTAVPDMVPGGALMAEDHIRMEERRPLVLPVSVHHNRSKDRACQG